MSQADVIQRRHLVVATMMGAAILLAVPLIVATMVWLVAG